VRFTAHAARDVEQAGERVVAQLGRAATQGAVIPVVIAHKGAVVERIPGEDCHHRARAVAVVDEEGVAVGAPAQLEAPAAAHEVVIRRIEWEQHPDPSVGVGVQHDEVAVLHRLDVDAGAVAAGELLVIEFNANGGVIGLQCDGRTGKRQQQRKYHGRLLEPRYTPLSFRKPFRPVRR
jgi:hypothetical protein